MRKEQNPLYKKTKKHNTNQFLLIMKKTLAVLMALTGVAMAEVTQELWSLDFTGTTPAYTLAKGVSLSNLPESANGGWTLNMSNQVLTQTGHVLTYADKFIYTVKLEINTLSEDNKWPELVGLGKAGAENNNTDHGDNWKCAYYKEAAKFVLDKNGFSSATEAETVKSISTTVDTPFTLSIHSDGQGKISMYVGDELVDYATLGSTDLTKTVEQFSFGGRVNVGKGGSNSDVTIYSAKLVKVIPEPTTATLSLLALAGLAARRRRR